MPSFKDNADRDWELLIDAPAILRIREECDENFMLGDDREENTYQRLQNDPVLLCRVIYLLCRSQREQQGVSEEDFYMEVIGDAIDRATEALLAAIVNFTPQSKREILIAVTEKEASVRKKVNRLAVAKMKNQGLEEKLLKAVEKQMDQLIEDSMEQLSATGLPALSASRRPA